MSTRLIRHTVIAALSDMSNPSYASARSLIEKLADADGVNVISCQSLLRALAVFDTPKRRHEAMDLVTHLCRILPIHESDIGEAIRTISASPKTSLEDAVESAFTARIKPDEIVDL